MQMGHPVHALRAEDADEFSLERNHRTVENARDARKRSPADDGIGVVTPHYIGVARGFGCQGILGIAGPVIFSFMVNSFGEWEAAEAAGNRAKENVGAMPSMIRD